MLESGFAVEASFIATWSSVDMRRGAGFKRGEDGFKGADQVEHLAGGDEERRAAFDGVGEGFDQDLQRVDVLDRCGSAARRRSG